MAQSGSEIHPARHRRGVNWAVIISVLSVGFTGATLYLSYFYVTQHLNVNVTHLHYARREPSIHVHRVCEHWQ